MNNYRQRLMGQSGLTLMASIGKVSTIFKLHPHAIELEHYEDIGEEAALFSLH